MRGDVTRVLLIAAWNEFTEKWGFQMLDQYLYLFVEADPLSSRMPIAAIFVFTKYPRSNSAGLSRRSTQNADADVLLWISPLTVKLATSAMNRWCQGPCTKNVHVLAAPSPTS